MSKFGVKAIFLFLILISLCCNHGFAGISFNSQESKIKVSSGARLNIGTSGFIVSGTLTEENGAFITGNSFTFSNGLLEKNNTEISATGVYDPSASNILNLVGNSTFRFEPGTVVDGIAVAGTGNIISGQPIFQNPITLLNATTELSIGIQDALAKNIELNGGKITLIGDLSLADNIKIVGPGTVDLNNRMLSLGGYYTSVWTDALIFQNAASITLNGNTQLSGIWTFQGECRLSGNGEILDLSSGGQIVIAPGTKLYLEDIIVKGLGDLAGKIVFTDATSELYLANTNLVLSGDFSTSVGSIFVEGVSTFVLAGYNWTINSPAILTVDAAALWLEVLSVEGSSHGQLRVSRAIYDANGYNASNVAANISDGTLVLNNNAAIKETISSSGSGTNPNIYLISGDVTNNFTMIQTLFLNSNNSINITGTAGVILDGNGQTIIFNNTSGPQFIVQENVSVTLENITLANINQDTFDIKPGGQILIGPDTIFAFSQDVTFSSGVFQVLDSIDGTVFTLESSTGNKVVTFNDQATLNLGDNTLRLQNIELGSIANISYGPNNLIELASGSSVDLDGNVGEPIGLNFNAIGPNNALTLMLDNLTLSGLIAFGDSSVNELAIRFVLLNGLDPDRILAGEIHPIVNFSGGPGIMLGGSPTNDARLILQNPYTVFNLIDSNAFLLDQNGQIFFKELELRSNDIKQYSANVLINGTRLVGQKIDPSFIRAYFGNQKPVTTSKPTSTPKTKISKDNKVSTTPKVTATPKIDSKPKASPKNTKKNFKDKKKINKRINVKNRKGIEDFNDILGIENSDNISSDSDLETLRSVMLPISYDNIYEDMQLSMSVPPTGNILLKTESHLSNMFTESNGVFAPLNITLQDHSMISMANKDVVLNPDTQLINIVGIGNVIEVQKTLTINNNLFMGEAAELTIRFVQSGSEMPMVIFAENTSIDIEYKGVLRFEGTGIVKLADGVVIALNGKKVFDKKTGKIISIERAQLIIHDGAILDFDENATVNIPTVNIHGVGSISVQDRGFIKPSAAGALIIGSEKDEGDDIDIEVTGSSEISLDLLESSNSRFPISQASISLWNLTSNINFQNGGILSIGDQGLFEINCNDSTLQSGNIKKFSFDGHGALFVKESGILRMAPNKIDASTGWDFKLDWFGFESTVNKSNDNNQNGSIEFVDFANQQHGSFTGIINPSNIALFKDYYKSKGTAITFETLASMLVNQKPDLLVSTLYNDPDGNQFVRTIDGISVQLKPGDVIDSDDKKTGKIFGHNQQNNFVILANGTRQ